MSFLTKVATDVANMVKGKSDEDRAERAEGLRKANLGAVVSWLFSFLSRTLEGNVRIDDSTAAMWKFLRNGGLLELPDLFRKFFEERADAFFIYELPKLWEFLANFPDEQDFVGEVYYNRALNYQVPEGGTVTDFSYVVKGIFNILLAAKANPATIKGLAETLLTKHSEIVGREDMSQTRRLLLCVAEEGKYFMPTQYPTATQGAREKGDGRRENRHAAPPAGEASEDDVRIHQAKTPPATAPLGEVARMESPKRFSMKEKKAMAKAANGAPEIPIDSEAVAEVAVQ